MARIEAKVQAGSLAAGAAGVALWALQTWVFKGGTIPAGLVSLIDLAVPAICAAAAGYLAPHTPRPPVAPVQALYTPGPTTTTSFGQPPAPPSSVTAETPPPGTGPVPPPAEPPAVTG